MLTDPGAFFATILIESANIICVGLQLNTGDVSRETFPLSNRLAQILERASEMVHNEYGFAIVRGLDSKRHSHESNIVIFAGLSSYVAAERQDFCKFQCLGFQQCISHDISGHIYDKESQNAAPSRRLRPPNRSVAMVCSHRATE